MSFQVSGLEAQKTALANRVEIQQHSVNKLKKIQYVAMAIIAVVGIIATVVFGSFIIVPIITLSALLITFLAFRFIFLKNPNANLSNLTTINKALTSPIDKPTETASLVLSAIKCLEKTFTAEELKVVIKSAVFALKNVVDDLEQKEPKTEEDEKTIRSSLVQILNYTNKVEDQELVKISDQCFGILQRHIRFSLAVKGDDEYSDKLKENIELCKTLNKDDSTAIVENLIDLVLQKEGLKSETGLSIFKNFADLDAIQSMKLVVKFVNQEKSNKDKLVMFNQMSNYALEKTDDKQAVYLKMLESLDLSHIKSSLTVYKLTKEIIDKIDDKTDTRNERLADIDERIKDVETKKAKISTVTTSKALMDAYVEYLKICRDDTKVALECVDKCGKDTNLLYAYCKEIVQFIDPETFEAVLKSAEPRLSEQKDRFFTGLLRFHIQKTSCEIENCEKACMLLRYIPSESPITNLTPLLSRVIENTKLSEVEEVTKHLATLSGDNKFYYIHAISALEENLNKDKPFISQIIVDYDLYLLEKNPGEDVEQRKRELVSYLNFIDDSNQFLDRVEKATNLFKGDDKFLNDIFETVWYGKVLKPEETLKYYSYLGQLLEDDTKRSQYEKDVLERENYPQIGDEKQIEMLVKKAFEYGKTKELDGLYFQTIAEIVSKHTEDLSRAAWFKGLVVNETNNKFPCCNYFIKQVSEGKTYEEKMKIVKELLKVFEDNAKGLSDSTKYSFIYTTMEYFYSEYRKLTYDEKGPARAELLKIYQAIPRDVVVAVKTKIEALQGDL